MREGDITLFCRNFSGSEFWKLSSGTLRCSRKFLATKIFRDERGEITFSHRFFFASHYRKLSLGTLQSFKKILAAKNLCGWKKGISRFFVEEIFNHSNGKFPWKLFVVSETFWYGKKKLKKPGGNANFRETFLVSFYRESALGTLRCSRIIQVAKTFYGCEEWYHVLPRKKFSITVTESFIGNYSWFQKLSGMGRKSWTRRGVMRISVKHFLSPFTEDVVHWEHFGVSQKF